LYKSQPSSLCTVLQQKRPFRCSSCSIEKLINGILTNTVCEHAWNARLGQSLELLYWVSSKVLSVLQLISASGYIPKFRDTISCTVTPQITRISKEPGISRSGLHELARSVKLRNNASYPTFCMASGFQGVKTVQSRQRNWVYRLNCPAPHAEIPRRYDTSPK
jgi:hypothetical protein